MIFVCLFIFFCVIVVLHLNELIMIKQCCFYVEMMLSQCIFPEDGLTSGIRAYFGSTFVQCDLVILDETEHTRTEVDDVFGNMNTRYLSYTCL